MTQKQATSLEDIFAGGGEMGALMQALDWSATPIGPVETWSQCLRTAVSICLKSRFPMVIWWGSDLVLLYNDAWRPALGSTKHPQALGRPGREIWSEIWHVIGPQLESVLTTGQATWSDDLLLLVERHGYTEETYYTYSYSPILLETGGVGGVFTAVTETTQRVLGERRLHTLRNLADRAAQAKTAEEACRMAGQTLASNPADIPFALLYLLAPDGKQLLLQESLALEAGTKASPERVELTQAESEPTSWPFAEVVRTGSAAVVDNLPERFGLLPSSPWTLPPQQALVLPLRAAGQNLPAGLLVAGASPCRVLDEDYRNFLEMSAGHIASAIANARAYEEERKRAEALAELDRAKTTFFSNVSHEFRTPLTLMLGPLSEMLAEAKDSLPPSQREPLQMVHRNGLRLLKLVNTLLDFSRIGAGRIQTVYEPTDLATFTAELASVFRSAIEQTGMSLLVDCPPLPEPIYVDREMWEKIVLNLLSNAFKFTFEGEIAVNLRWADDHVELEVRDTGTGIPAEELPHLFERFHRVKGARGRTYEGSGIGLSLVRELVRLHGGTVGVTSVVDEGTSFTVSIPTGCTHLPQDRISATRTLASTRVEATPYVEEALRWLPEEELKVQTLKVEGSDQPANLQPANLQPSTPTRILLADDNADMRNYVKRLLSQQYEVETVPDGVAALAAIRQRPPDLVLTDVMMPGHGLELLRQLRADPQTREIPIILLSARAGEEARVEGLEAGADDYLIKPFSARELLARIDANLKMARMRQESYQRERAIRAEVEVQWQRLHDLFVQVPAIVGVIRVPDLVYLLANPGLCQLYGNRQLVGKTVREAHPELEGQGFFELLDRVCATGEPFVANEMPATIDRDNNGILNQGFFNFVYQPMLDAEGRVEAVLLFAVEVTDQVLARQRVEELASVLTAERDQLQLEIAERKRLEDELRRREQEFSTLVENSPDIIFRLDRNLRYIYVSPVVEHVSGMVPQQFLGKTGREMGLPSDVCDLFEATCREAIATGQVTRVEYSIDGRDYSSRLIPERALDGSIESLMGITEDITEGKRSQRRVAAQYAISRVLTEAATLAEAVPTLLRSLCESLEWQLGVIWSVDRQANVLRCVNTWHVPSANVEEFVEATQHTTFTPSVGLPGRIWASGQPAWIENISADDNFPRAAFAARGGLQTAFGFPIRLGNEILGVIECFSDTIQKLDEDLLQMMAAVGSQIGQFMERKQAEEALRQSEERLRVGLKNSPVTVFNQDRELRYTWEYNPESEYDAEDVVGKCDADLLPRDDAEVLTQIKRQVLETGVGAREEVKITIDGRDWYFDLTVEPLRDANNEVIGVTCAAVDISERKQAEMALRQSEARFQRLATNVPGVICRYLLHPDGSDVMPYISPSCRNLFELEPETIEQNVDTLWALVHPEDVNALGDAIAFSARTEQPLRWESRYVMPSGRLKWIQFVSRAERQTDGSVLWDGLLLDITHFKEAAEEREQLLARERQYANQLRGLTSAALAINSALSVEEVLNVITEQAREIIGAHQSLACMAIDQNWAEATVSISLSDKYAAWRDYQAEPDGSGIYACVWHTNRPMRMTQAELEAHPSWRGFGNEAAKHPPMRGWLAAPLVGRDGHNIGLIQLSDKYAGEFTEEDEAILVQLAQMASVAIENARLYEAEQQARDEAVSEAERSAAAVEALSVSESRFRMMADGAPVFIWMSGLDGHCSYFNQLWLDFVGQTLEEALTIGWPEGIHPDDLQYCLDTYMRAFNARDRFQIEYRHRRKDGEYRWLLDQGVPLFNPDGSFAGYIGSGIDLTERKQAEEALQESEARFRGVVESNLVGILFWDAAGYLTDGNNIAMQMLGYSREELQARRVKWRHITPPEYYRVDSEMLQQILSTGSCPPFEKEYIRKDGWRVPILLGGALLPGYTDRGVAFMLDITERKQVEASQRLLAEASSVLVSSLDYQTTLSSIARLVVPTLADFCYFDVVTADGKIQRVAWHHKDPAKQEWFNKIQQYVPPQEFENHPVAAVLSSGKAKLVPDVSDAWMQVATTKPEHLQFMRDSQLHSLITVPLIARNRKLGALTLCLETQSRRHYTNADLALAEELAYRAALALDNAQLYHQAQEANRIKDEFLAVLSHELRSPLNPILGWTKLLRSRKFDEKATDRALETIERNAMLQAQLIEDLLDVSRILRGKLVLNVTPVNLATTIEAALETVHLAAQAKQISIETVLDPSVGQVLGDANRLQQVIWNLLSNAVKFTPQGGWVEVRLQKVEEGLKVNRLKVEGDAPGVATTALSKDNIQPSTQYAQIQVKDNGKGISPEFLPHVFEYFRQADSTTTRRFGGLGLGLAIVHHLAELHGGSVFAESPGEGLGATFTVRLPLMVAHPEPTREEVQSNRSADLSGLRVLVVDDEADIRELVTFILQESGAEVTVTASASEALAALNQSVPDVLLSDIGMPDVDGYMLMRQVRAFSPERGGQIPAIALTAYAGEYNQQQALAAGFQLHVSKPVEPDELVRAIANLVGM